MYFENNPLIANRDDIIKYVSINDSAYDNDLNLLLWDVQNRYVLGLLGTELYQELLIAIESNTITTAQKDLINRLIEFIAKYTIIEYINRGNYSAGALGFTELTNPESTKARDSQINYISRKYNNDLKRIASQIEAFILANKTDYKSFNVNCKSRKDNIFMRSVGVDRYSRYKDIKQGNIFEN